MQQLYSLQDVKKQKLNIMRTQAPDTHQTYEWVMSNQKLFEKPVIFPFMEIQVKDDQHAKYLEFQLGKNIWVCLVQTDKDRDTIAKQTDLKEWRVLVIKMAGTGGPPHHPFDLENAKLPGVTHWLDQIFDAPPLVKAAMIDLSSLDRCMVGTQKN